jgi:3-phenylpropionate/trans-cinnamate dioxygenase ferredoxin reductase subunit
VSERFELLAVGAGPAALAAARSFRAAGGRGEVALIADEHRVPYRRPPLTKELLRGELDERELPIEPESWYAANRVRLICGRAVALDPQRRELTLSGGRVLRYRHCVLATGGEPKRLALAGADDPAVRVVRTLDHVRELLWRLAPGEPVIVIGAGFIGCEIAASLSLRSHPVSVFCREQQPNEERLGAEAGAQIRRWLAQLGVELHCGQQLERIERDGARLSVIAEGARGSARCVVMAVGIAPRGELAQAAGIPTAGGAIRAGSDMRTECDGVLAAGDVALALNAAAGRELAVEHWGEALAHGEVAGRVVAGEEASWDRVPGFWSTIGARTLKYASWGDGFDRAHLQEHADGAFTVWYGRGRALVGVLAHGRDEDYERGRELVAAGAPWQW